ncbi:MAG: ribonuclease HII [Acidobacteriota bacterium]|jgi:ribonuclease HII|nr:ribonuclease HII [Acidobacteriota bacterium]
MTSGVDVLGSKDRDLLLGANAIIGVDEVGRGALAGPVVVCAAAFEEIPDDGEVRDSKLLSPRRRASIAVRLRSSGARWVVCEVWPELIDRINILEATRIAMAAAARTLIAPRSVVITDYVNPGDLGCRILSPKRADRDYFCVAAASIVAKVHRDRIMVDLGRQDPRWKWERNKGYGTVDHRRALQNVGPGILHRRSFGWSPVLP